MELELLHRAPAGTPVGRPLLFVHGAWHGAWCWDRYVLPYVAGQGRDAYALSLRGHAGSGSDRPLRRTRIAHYVEDVRAVAERIGSAPVLIGHSMGGLVVQRALEVGIAPAAVLLASVPPRGAWGALFRVLRRHPLALLKANLTLSLRPLVTPPERARDLLFSPTTPRADADWAAERVQDESYAAFLDMLLFGLAHPRRVRVPLLVLGGSEDRLFPERDVAATAHAYRTEHRMFADTGHDVMLEPRWQEIADAMLAWLGERGL
jgi:pimeloyl-ACP methyl ester carboxylesterase